MLMRNCTGLWPALYVSWISVFIRLDCCWDCYSPPVDSVHWGWIIYPQVSLLCWDVLTMSNSWKTQGSIYVRFMENTDCRKVLCVLHLHVLFKIGWGSKLKSCLVIRRSTMLMTTQELQQPMRCHHQRGQASLCLRPCLHQSLMDHLIWMGRITMWIRKPRLSSYWMTTTAYEMLNQRDCAWMIWLPINVWVFENSWLVGSEVKSASKEWGLGPHLWAILTDKILSSDSDCIFVLMMINWWCKTDECRVDPSLFA